MTPTTKWRYYPNLHKTDYASPSWLQRQSLKEEVRWPNAFSWLLGALFVWSVVFAVIAYIAFWQ
jgi:hypothetical protein